MALEVLVKTTSWKEGDSSDTMHTQTRAVGSADTILETKVIPDVIKGIVDGHANAHARAYASKEIAEKVLVSSDVRYIAAVASKYLPGT